MEWLSASSLFSVYNIKRAVRAKGFLLLWIKYAVWYIIATIVVLRSANKMNLRDRIDMKIRNSQVLPKKINTVLDQFVEQSVKRYEQHIKKIILYGSYARGDYNEDSDIDLMVLVDYQREKISDVDDGLSDIGYDISYDNDFIEISTIMQNADFFDKWVGSYPFYSNIKNEGVELYAVCASGKRQPLISTGKA